MFESDSHPQGPMNDTPTSPAKSVDGDAETGTLLLPIMWRWKSDVSRGATAADDASLRLFDWLDARGQGGARRYRRYPPMHLWQQLSPLHQ